MSEYKIVEADSTSHLGFKVESYLRSGWKVTGGMTVVGNRYMQAMVYEEPPKGGGQ